MVEKEDTEETDTETITKDTARGMTVKAKGMTVKEAITADTKVAKEAGTADTKAARDMNSRMTTQALAI